jgi:uncharacterized protein
MSVNNKLLPCERIGHQFSFGKVTDHGVEIDGEEVAQKYNSQCDLAKKLCSRCYHVGQCPICMFGIENPETRPVCHSFVKKSGFNQYLHGVIEELSQSPELYKRIMEEVVRI